MRKTVAVLAVFALVGSVASRAEAQVRFGAQVNWGSDTDFGLGARLNFGLDKAVGVKGLEAVGSFDYYFPSGFNYWEINGNALYRITVQNTSVGPYVGAGLSIGHSSPKGSVSTGCNLLGVSCSSTDAGLNLLGGLRFKASPSFAPFVEAKVQVRSGSQFVISAGSYFGHI